MKLPWFRAYTEMVDDEKLKLLAFEDRWHFMALLCIKGQGLLDKDEALALKLRKVAVKMGLDLRTLDEVARRLEEVGLIDRETLQPVKWDDRQMRSDADPTAADRKRRQRERAKAPPSPAEAEGTDMSRVTVTDVTRTEVDTDTDKEGEKTVVELAAVAVPASRTAAAASAKPSRGTTVPSDFVPDQTAVGIAASTGVDLKAELANFLDHHAARGTVFKDWQAGFRTWLRNAVKFGQRGQGAGKRSTPPPAQSFAERDREAGMARWEEMTGRVHPDRQQHAGAVIDITPSTRQIGAPA